MVHSVECLPSTQEVLGSILGLYKPGLQAPAWNSSIWEEEAGESEIRGLPQLLSEFEANLGYMRPCLNRKKQEQKRKQKNGQGLLLVIFITHLCVSVSLCVYLTGGAGACGGQTTLDSLELELEVIVSCPILCPVVHPVT